MADYDIDTEQFGVQLESYPALWDRSHPDFKNKNKKDSATRKLAAQFIPGYEQSDSKAKDKAG